MANQRVRIVLWPLALAAAVLSTGCNLLLPLGAAPNDPDAARDGAADTRLLSDGPVPWVDTAPLPDAARPDLGSQPDLAVADQLVVDQQAHDQLVPDEGPPLCPGFKTFGEDVNVGWSVQQIGGSGSITQDAVETELPMGVGGALFRADPGGLACAPSGQGMEVAFTRYCTTGSFKVMLYDVVCYTYSQCTANPPLLTCGSTCSYNSATKTELCTASLGGQQVRTIMIYRPGGNSLARAKRLELNPPP